MRITIDGPSGAGKTSLAKEIAVLLGIQHIDTGAMYRAIAYKLQRDNLNVDDENKIVEVAKKSVIEFINKENNQQALILDGEDISKKIRSEEISSLASKISTYPKFREQMVKAQRNIAAAQDSVLEGRDIGSVVLPDAEFKFYITASAEIRAARRMKQMKKRGEKVSDFDYEIILKDIKARDKRDMTREHSPLIIPEGAIVIDNSELTKKETIDKIIDIIKK